MDNEDWIFWAVFGLAVYVAKTQLDKAEAEKKNAELEERLAALETKQKVKLISLLKRLGLYGAYRLVKQLTGLDE
jgi:hypothetical protein